MRYGSCKSQSPALLAGSVVARSQRRLPVSPARLADAPPPLHLGAVGRAITLPPIATGADDHQPTAPRAVEHPVALLDGRAPATEGWTQRPPPAILSLIAVFIALAVARKPRPLHQRPGLRLLGGGPVLPHRSVAGHATLGHAAGRRYPRHAPGATISAIRDRRVGRTISRAFCARGENHIQRLCAGRTRTSATP